MYGIVEIAGHQYKVKVGDLVDVEKLREESGKVVKFDQILFVGGETPRVGLPLVEGAQVVAKVLKHDKGRKIDVFKSKPGRYRKTKGHRQEYTALLITEIKDGQGKVDKIDPSVEPKCEPKCEEEE